MIFLFTKSQLSLFNAPVHVAAHVRRDGTVVAPHMRIQKVAVRQPSLFVDHHAPEPAQAPKRSKLDVFMARYGGPNGMARILADMTYGQRKQLIAKMAEVGKTTPEAVTAMIGAAPAEVAAPTESDLFSQPSEPESAPEPVEAAPEPEHKLVEHVTGRGKTLRGIVRTDLNGHQAAAIDPYTFRKNGGWFIREKYLTGDVEQAPAKADEPHESEKRAEAVAAVDKSNAQALKLREAGEKLIAASEEDLNRDRNTNTARRASMAASAEAEAAKRLAIGKTMVNLSFAIEDGEARHLSGVSTRAAVEALDYRVTQAIYETDRNLSYSDLEKRKGRPADAADIANAKLPQVSWSTAGADTSKLIESLKGKKGGKDLIAEIQRSRGPTQDMITRLKKVLPEKDVKYCLGWWNIEKAAELARLQKLGITDDHSLRLALAEYLHFREGRKAVDPVKEAERALVGQKVGIDFFPTPKALAVTMAEMAGIKPGMTVLEPSAGNGRLADAARDAGAEVDTIEVSDTLRNVLAAKKHNVIASNFEMHESSKQYDAVLMNPPFSDRKDALHIMRAWDMVKPGGKLVAIAGEGVFFGSDARAKAFRDWLDERGAEVEKLPDNTFMGADQIVQTGANARLISMVKPAVSESVAESGPQEGERNADGLVFRDGRWHREDVEDAAPPELAPTRSTEFEAAEDRTDLAEAMAEDPHSEKSKRMLASVAQRHADAEEPAEPDVDSPSSANYRYADTGYIAGSRKEMAASQVISRARKDGAQVLVTGLDWDTLEQNPREAKELITKSNLFGVVDWAALRSGGMEPGAGFLVDRIYASIATEPSEDKPQARRDYTLGLQTLRTRLEACTTAAQVTDVLDNLREEYDGKILTAEESVKYQELSKASSAAWKEDRAIDEASSELYRKMNDARYQVNVVENEIEKRKRRGWSAKPELQAQADALRPAAEAAEKAWSDHIHANKARREELRAIRQDAHHAQQSIQLMAYARNKIENPLHRAWNTMGERFVNVLRYRNYNGSDAFAKHVAVVKAGKIADWSWAEREVTRAPRISKESVRFQLKVADTYERVGGRAVTPQSTMELKEMFGLRDVQSGNWVLRDVTSAKFHTEHCAAAFADLADLLGAPDAQISLNGRLAMAFGARGQGAKGFKDGAARADYSPVHRVINLTKMGGGGCLAHEWFHALDNIAKEAEGMGQSGIHDYATENPDILPPGELRDAFHALRSAMLDGQHQATEVVEYSAHDVKVAKHNLSGMYVNAVGKKILAAGNVHAAVAAIDDYFKPGADGKMSPKTKKLARDWRRIAVAHYGGDADGGSLEVKGGPPMSAFAIGAVQLDQGGTAYFSQTMEMGARAFQSWVEDRLGEIGRRNDYLSAYADNKYHVDPLLGIEWKPYPEGDERTRINAAFDRLFAAVGASGTLAKAMAL